MRFLVFFVLPMLAVVFTGHVGYRFGRFHERARLRKVSEQRRKVVNETHNLLALGQQVSATIYENQSAITRDALAEYELAEREL